jgi:hypothetical protein
MIEQIREIANKFMGGLIDCTDDQLLSIITNSLKYTTTHIDLSSFIKWVAGEGDWVIIDDKVYNLNYLKLCIEKAKQYDGLCK